MVDTAPSLAAVFERLREVLFTADALGLPKGKPLVELQAAMGLEPRLTIADLEVIRTALWEKLKPAKAADSADRNHVILCGEHMGLELLWWRPNSSGYTTKLAEAGRYTCGEATRIQHIRGTDLAIWDRKLTSEATLAEEIEHKARFHRYVLQKLRHIRLRIKAGALRATKTDAQEVARS